MKIAFSAGVRMMLVFATFVLAACASYSGSNLKPGVSTLAAVIDSMGPPAMSWKNPDGSEQLAYPRGPAGTQTFMAYIGADGKLQRIDGVLGMANFALIQPGISKDSVLRLIGPSQPEWTQSYSGSNTVSWTWLFCNSQDEQSYFDVAFDATTGVVRSTEQRLKQVLSGIGNVPPCGQ